MLLSNPILRGSDCFGRGKTWNAKCSHHLGIKWCSQIEFLQTFLRMIVTHGDTAVTVTQLPLVFSVRLLVPVREFKIAFATRHICLIDIKFIKAVKT